MTATHAAQNTQYSWQDWGNTQQACHETGAEKREPANHQPPPRENKKGKIG